MTNHYGASLNAIPVLAEFARHPDDLYLLRVGYAGMSSVLANIDASGHGSYGFNADPAILEFDPYTADYGVAFYGYAASAGAYVVHDRALGWLGFGCDVEETNGTLKIVPRDAFRRRLVAGACHLTLEAGTLESAVMDLKTHTVRLVLGAATPETPRALLRIESPGSDSKTARPYVPVPTLPTVRGAYTLPLAGHPTSLMLKAEPEK
jgi:hypothetical protein